MAASSCSEGDADAAGNETPIASSTLGVSPLPAAASAVAAPTTVDAATTVAPPTTAAVEVTTTPAPPAAAPAETTPTVAPMTMLPTNVEFVDPFPMQLQAIGSGSGEATKWVQMRLIQLGFWNSAADGRFGLTTKQAVMAFQKYIGLPATGSVDTATAAYLTNMTERAHGLTNAGDLIEIDKQKQLLFIIRGGKTLWVLNTSTGNGLPYEEEDMNSPGEIQTGVSITSDGLWKVNRERPEGWWEGDLGEIYRPKYFHGGQAVHGSNSVPNYPASHGCVRVTVPAMDWIWEQDLMPMGITVWVHGG
jgi:peptidoglycan hydrolase-like protein with peptidoglycan-binding domain